MYVWHFIQLQLSYFVIQQDFYSFIHKSYYKFVYANWSLVWSYFRRLFVLTVTHKPLNFASYIAQVTT